MCMYFSSEVILSNLLNWYHDPDQGVDINLIQQYCKAIKNELSVNNEFLHEYVLFQSNCDMINEAVARFPEQFYSFMGRFYKGKEFNSIYFNQKYALSDRILETMHNAAQNI